MHKILTAVLFIVFVFISFSQSAIDKKNNSLLASYQSAESKYKKADLLAEIAGDDEIKITASEQVYKQALSEYNLLMPDLLKNQLDSLFLLSSIKTGLIYNYLDSLPLARAAFATAIHAKEKLPALDDSLLFQPLLFTGSICYNAGEFDSAFYYLKKAEAIKNNYSQRLKEEQRLYNLLGVIYYATGNIKQSKNYIEKAIEILTTNRINDPDLLINYQVNIASILIKLEEYDKAAAILKKININNSYKDEINHKLGFIHLKTNQYNEAIQYFDKSNYSNSKRIIDLLLNKSMAFTQLHEIDSATYYLLRAKSENFKWNGSKKNISYGLILKQEADIQAENNQHKEAIVIYQQAISQFSNNFSDTAISKNPEIFSGVFSYIELFNALTAKGDAFQKLYEKEKVINYLESALNAYQSAFKLAYYVEKTYDSDEARLFLNKLKHIVHSKPIDISLSLFNLTHKKEYLEETYFFDQKNKASVLSLNVQANEIKQQSGQSIALIEKEHSLKSAITRLSLKAGSITDTLEWQKNYSLIRDNEIELAKLQDELNADPAWQQKRTDEQIPSVGELQKRLDHSTTLLSFHLSENELLVLLISANQFEYYKSPVDKVFFTDIELLKKSLYNTADNSRYAGTDAATSLYNKLFLPIQSKLQEKKRLIIIPDDELNYLPFEVLQNENKKYIIEKFSIQYQFSTALLGININKSPGPFNTLAFAPFASNGYKDSSGESFSSLPASKEEINDLKGKVLIDAAATKNNFLDSANHFRIVHLATHASVNNQDPMRSFITFYPAGKDYKLYAGEIYDLKLDSLQLIILSACETGSGQLVKGEGLMSLSRAFTYAGCSNIITSLWKAEDKTTAYITGRLHYYLDKKFTKDQALQQAKLDLLTNSDIDPRLKAPNYWAHLIFIGNYEANHKTNNWWWIALTIIAGAFLYKGIKQKKPR